MMGTGYVGLVAGVCFAHTGHRVICMDSNHQKIFSLQQGHLPFFEPELEKLYQLHFRSINFVTEAEIAIRDSDVIFITLDTPEKEKGETDMSAIDETLSFICQRATQAKVLVLKSTVPIGTAQRAQAYCHQHTSVDIEVVSNPEFLRQGQAVHDFLHPDRIVVGCGSQKARDLMTCLYEPFLKGKSILFMDTPSAEMTKYAANSYLAIKISYINELALLAEEWGANINLVREGFTRDHRINPSFFDPGIGYGGSCFPKDVRSFIHQAQKSGFEMGLLQAADNINERQKSLLVRRLVARLGDLENKRIALWGLSFKPNTDDIRRAPSIGIIEELVKMKAKPVAYDPLAMKKAVAQCRVKFEVSSTALLAASGAEALLIVTEWSEFKMIKLKELKSVLKTALIFDGRNIFDPKVMATMGFEYHGIGNTSNISC